ncbi:GNAT family N-acetyltransferase [Kytococcus sedentarius]|uniref:GNAT family N-acetyltransferase n=1 Tax=Kytococcus sedentarius TaxID=1276 RepID=UPI003879F573
MKFLDRHTAATTDLPFTDVYHTPEYGASAELIDGGTWECAVADSGDAMYAYLRRPIQSSATGEYDIVSPYGYGGPIASSAAGLAAFRQEFLTESRERGLVAEFIRTHPWDYDDDNLAALASGDTTPHTTYTVARTEDVEEYFTGAEGRHRTAVRKALKNELTIRKVDAAAATDASHPFRVIYADTMERVGASSRLRLGDDYFEALAAVRPEVDILMAEDTEGVVQAAAMFMAWEDRLHYHLSGATVEGQRIGATNLVLDHAVRELMSPGMRLHLGGGVQEGDGLSKFKRSLATETSEIHLCRTIVNPTRYAELCREAGDPETEFFPAYRAPKVSS